METKVVAYSATEAALIELTMKYDGVVFDVTTTIGMAEAKEARKEMRAHRMTLEAARVREKAESLAYGRFVDSEAKRISDRIAALEEPIAAMIDAEVNKEKLAEEEAKRVMKAKRDAIEKALAEEEESRMASEKAEIAKSKRSTHNG